MTLSIGQPFPKDVTLAYIPIDISQSVADDVLVCERPIPLSLDTLFAKYPDGNKAIVSVPGAFTPTCTENHIPPILQHLADLKKEKNIDVVIILSANDPFVINAWGKLLVKANVTPGNADYPKLIFASDPNAKFSQDLELEFDGTAIGFGMRSARYAIIVGADNVVKYVAKESGSGVEVSGYEALSAAKL